jgi:hypothetical protein
LADYSAGGGLDGVLNPLLLFHARPVKKIGFKASHFESVTIENFSDFQKIR